MPMSQAERRFGRAFAIVTAAALLVALLPANVLAAPAQPDFTVEPGGAVVGQPFATQPVVSIIGRRRAVDASATGSITLSITSNPSGGALTCAGGLSKGLAAGVAYFSGCTINQAGNGYTLQATWDQGGSATSAQFNVTTAPGTATKLGFAQQPGGGAVGVAWAVQPVVAVQDAGGSTVTTSTASVILAIGTNPGGGVLTCLGGLTKSAVSGIAAFTGCKIDKAGVGYTLTASSSGLTTASSAQFDVADRLVFTTQPNGATAGTAFITQPVVAVRAGATNTATHDQVTQVTLSIGTNPGGGTLTCTGGLSKTAVAGVATFAGCAISTGGTGYTLVANSPGLTSVTSAPFNVTGVTLLVVNPSASVINYPSSVTLFVHMASLGIARTVDLQTSRDLVNWSALAALSTNTAGDASFTYAPGTNLYYRASFAGAPGIGAGTSLATRVIVRQSVALKPNAGAIRLVSRGTRITYTATVRPLPSAGSARVTFLIYRRVSGVWVFRTSATLPANGAGIATFAWTWGRGEWYIRARANTTTYNAARLSAIARIVAR